MQYQRDNKSLAIPEGLEPSTCRLEVGCSIQLSYGTTCVPFARCRWFSQAGAGRKMSVQRLLQRIAAIFEFTEHLVDFGVVQRLSGCVKH